MIRRIIATGKRLKRSLIRMCKRPRRRLDRRDILQALGVAAGLVYALTLMAWQLGLFADPTYRASAVVHIDPDARYAELRKDLNGWSNAITPIDDEIRAIVDDDIFEAALRQTIDGGFEPSDVWSDIADRKAGLAATAIGQSSIEITADDSNPDIAAAIVKAVAERFASSRNRQESEKMRSIIAQLEGGAAEASQMAAHRQENQSSKGGLLSAGSRRHVEQSSKALAGLRSLSGETLTIEDIVDVDGSARAITLLLERATIAADLAALGQDDPARTAKTDVLDQINRQIAKELDLLVAVAEEEQERMAAASRLPSSEPQTDYSARALLETTNDRSGQLSMQLENAGLYAVLAPGTQTAIAEPRITLTLVVIGKLSLLGTLLFLLLRRSHRPKQEIATRRDPIARQTILDNPHWPLNANEERRLTRLELAAVRYWDKNAWRITSIHRISSADYNPPQLPRAEHEIESIEYSQRQAS